MDAITFWKNFNLGKELSLSGSYLFNGLKTLDEMENFYFEEEIFEFLYSISVGIERLQKIAIILKENVLPENQNEFEASLITHNHMELMKRLRASEIKKLSTIHNEFLSLLSLFYKSWRYDRFSVSDFRNYNKEKCALIAFVEKHLSIKISEEMFNVTPNSPRIKKFLGRTIGKIVEYNYEIIERESSRLNIYTYEIRVDSKAYKIFMRKEYDFIKEEIFWKELLLFIINKSETNDLLSFFKNKEPLEFDEGMLPQLIASFKSDLLKQEHLDMLDVLYEDLQGKKERLEFLDLIGNENFMLENEEEEMLTEATNEF